MITLKNKKIKYLELIKVLATTDFKLKYQGSVLGYFWSLIKPLAYFAILYVIFTMVFKIGNSVPHYPVYLLLGVLIFSYWSEATSSGMTAIVSKGDLIRKIYFPRIVLVISSTTTAAMTFLLNMIVVLVFAYFNKVIFHWGMLISFVYFVELYFFILGVSFYLSALYVKFRDIGHIWEVVNQILFYATPLLYLINSVPIKYARLMVLSPLAQIILDVRHSFIGSGILTIRDYWGAWYLPPLLVLFILISGYFVFQRMAAKFAEEI